MNLDYWEEQIKATLVTAAHLAVPVEYGFTLAVAPPSRTIAPGGVATYTIEVEPSGDFTATVGLVAASPSPSLTLDLYPQAIDPPGQAMLTLTDTHTFPLSPGLWYTVPITATSNGITRTASVSLLVEEEPPCDPVDVVTVTTEISGCAVAFGADLTGTEPFTYAWDFGAFGPSSVPTPTIDFGASSEYPYALTASNCNGVYSDTLSGTVTVDCEIACDPVDVVTVTTEISGCAVAFGADLTGTEPFTYAWDFGAFGPSSVPTPTIDFGASSSYPYALTAFNCNGIYSDTLGGMVTVDCGIACEPVDILTITTEILGCAVAFGAELTGTAPYGYAWDFGAFGSSTEPEPTVDLEISGTYAYSLTASNCGIYTTTMTGSVTVACEPQVVYYYLPLVARNYADSPDPTATPTPAPTDTPIPPAGDVYYVAPDGDDSNPGTLDEPWASPDKAADTARAGDTVFFRGGLYNGRLILQHSGTADAWITFTAYPGEQPEIYYDSTYYNRPVLIGPSQAAPAEERVEYVEVSGLIIESCNPANDCANGEGIPANGAGIYMSNVRHIRIVGNTVRYNAMLGISAQNVASDVLISGNVVYGNSMHGTWCGSAVTTGNVGCFWPSYAGWDCLKDPELDDEPIVIRDNIVYNNRNDGPDGDNCNNLSDGNGIILDHNGQDNSPTLVANNVVFNNGGDCIHVLNTWHVDVVNNSCYQNVQTPRLFDINRPEISVQAISGNQDQWGRPGSVDDVDIVNNIAYSRAGGYPFRIVGGQPVFQMDYNLWFNGNMPENPGPHDILDQDPLYQNPTLDPLDADFHLQVGSPAIDAGTDAFGDVVDSDYDGTERPQGAGYDMGAYEQ